MRWGKGTSSFGATISDQFLRYVLPTVKKFERFTDYATLFYLSLPVLIFLVGWLKLIIGIPLALLLCAGVIAYLSGINTRSVNWQAVAKPQIMLTLLVAFGWVYLSGIGGYSNQDWDHHYRNAVFNDLLQFNWPIYFKFAPDYTFEFLAGHKAALNYYFAYWLPAALMGKWAGQGVANASLLAWTYLGVLLVFFHLFRLLNSKHLLLAVVLFALWSGLDVLGKLLIQRHLVGFNEPIEIYYYFSYTSFTTDLFNVFNQALPAWIVTLWVLTYRERIPVLPIALLFPYGPFPFISLTLFYILYFIVENYDYWRSTSTLSFIQKSWSRIDLISASAAVVAIGFPFLAFYKAHFPVNINQFFGARLVGESMSTSLTIIGFYVLTFSLEAGLFYALIRWISPATYKAHKTVFWLSFLLLLLIPLWEAGLWRDFASRGSIPMLTVLAFLMIRAISQVIEQRPIQLSMVVVAVVLLLSWCTPFWLLLKAPAVGETPRLRNDVVSLGNTKASLDSDKDGVLSSLPYYYSVDPQHKFFYRLLAKKQAP